MQVDQSFTTTGDANSALRFSTLYQKNAQQFTAGITGGVEQVDLTLYKVGAPTGNIWVEIWSDTGANLPNAQIGVDSATYDISALGTNVAGAWISFAFATKPAVVAGTKYWIVIDGDWTINTSNYVAVKFLNAGGYAAGIPANIGEGAWETTTYGTTMDFLFREYGPSGNFLAIL